MFTLSTLLEDTMNIVLLTAVSRDAGHFTERASTIADFISSQGNTLIHHELSDMDIHYCTGCFNCWWKTPGKCIFSDDMEILYPEILSADLLIFASPLIMGLPSYRIKQCQDRLIPLLHPYITLIKGECHHRKRYEKYPDISLIVQKEPDTGTEDIQFLIDLHHRLALNFHSKFRGIGATDMATEEVYHETCGL